MLSAGVVLSAASKCDTPNVKSQPASHRVAPRPSTGEPKKHPSGQRAAKADQPGRSQRAASAETSPGSAAEAASPASRQAPPSPSPLESTTAQVTTSQSHSSVLLSHCLALPLLVPMLTATAQQAGRCYTFLKHSARLQCKNPIMLVLAHDVRSQMQTPV